MKKAALAAATGARIADALAMPAHWYYDTRELAALFGRVDSYLPPPQHHTGSILWRSSYEPREPEFDILGGEREQWGRRGVHYHRNLLPGENTLNLKLMNLVLALVDEIGGYDRQEYIRRYRAFMLAPSGHRDTYVEECHRGFFENLKRGVPAARAAVEEKHIGGMVPVVPLYARLRALGESHEEARREVLDHVSVTHAGARVESAADTLIQIAAELLEEPEDGPQGLSRLSTVLGAHLEGQDLEYLRGPIARLAATEAPPRVIGPRYSPACYLEDSMPATFYLALRYADRPAEGLIENVMAGGDNCHRGAVLGALYGLAGGTSLFPDAWIEGLRENS
ncbi:MAG: ADP-ribosylglycohydrolase family protein [Spirochaetaceae bacterium]